VWQSRISGRAKQLSKEVSTNLKLKLKSLCNSIKEGEAVVLKSLALAEADYCMDSTGVKDTDWIVVKHIQQL